MIRCGWCGGATRDEITCDMCGRDPVKPYRQRGKWPPQIETPERGRPHLDVREARKRIESAEYQLRQQGRAVTTEAVAELLGVDPRTIRRWRQ